MQVEPAPPLATPNQDLPSASFNFSLSVDEFMDIDGAEYVAVPTTLPLSLSAEGYMDVDEVAPAGMRDLLIMLRFG